MKIQINLPRWFSEIGQKENQEDFLWPNPQKISTNQKIFIMCDGVGGQDSGEVASETAACALGIYLTSHRPKDGYLTEVMFNEALNYAYDELDKKDTGAQRKMGTTMTCVVFHRGGALVAHIGDSRIYQIRPSLANAENGLSGIIYQSADHSLVNDLLRAGEINENEAKNFTQKNVITRAMQPHLERRYKADIYNLDDIQDGDYFFLCCDGVLEQLTNEKLGEILAERTLDDAGKIAAIKSICDGNTKDNYTCWLVPINKVDREKSDIVEEDELQAIVDTSDNTQNAEQVVRQETLKDTTNLSITSQGRQNDGNYEIKDTKISKSESALSTKPRKKFYNYIFFPILLVVVALGAWLGGRFMQENKDDKIGLDTISVNDSGKKDSLKNEINQQNIEARSTKKEDAKQIEVKHSTKVQKTDKPQETTKPDVINSIPDDGSEKNTLIKNNSPKPEKKDEQP